jgi:hypothetical protein
MVLKKFRKRNATKHSDNLNFFIICYETVLKTKNENGFFITFMYCL